jgi:hypothetical protein
LDVTLAHPDLQHYADLLRTLGVDGMSGDESDDDIQGNRLPVPFTAFTPFWRNPAVTEWLRILDDVFLYDQLRAKKPNELPARERCLFASPDHVAVPGLPVSFYRPKWLRGLDPTTLASLQVQPWVNLQFSAKILR